MSTVVNKKCRNSRILFSAASLLMMNILINTFINNPAYADDPGFGFMQNQQPSLNLPNSNQPNESYQQFADESDIYYKHGMDFLTSHQYSQAIDALEKALSVAPERSNTRINLAVAYINRGTYFYNELKDVSKASDDYRNAIYFLKYDAPMQSSDIVSENLGIAKTDLDNMITAGKTGTSKSARLRIAKELRGEGNFRGAIVEFNEALVGNQSDLPICIALGDMYDRIQNSKYAEKYYQKAVFYNVNDIDLHLKLARAMHNSGDVEDAVKEYNIALNTSKEENKAEVLKTLEEIWVQKLRENPQDAIAHMNLGVVLQKKGDLDGALREYQYAQEINPNDITTRLNIGTLFQAKKDYDTAIKAYDSILQVKPDDMLTHYYRGTALKEVGQPQEAVKEFQIVLSKDPENANAKQALFDTIKMFSNPQDVTTIFKTFADNNPTDAAAQYQYAMNLHSAGSLDAALDYYEKALALNPELGDAYLNIATIYKLQKQDSKSLAILETGIKTLPKNQKIKEMLNSMKSETVSLKYQNALNLHKEGNYNEAIKEYLKVIQLSEPDSDLYLNLGAAYQAAKKLDEAVLAYKKAVTLNSKNSTAYYYLGTVYSSQGKDQMALANFRKASALDPSNDDIKQALSDAAKSAKENSLENGINLYNKGKYAQALLTFNSLSIKDPDDGYVYYYRGMVYDDLKKYQLAIADYKVAIKLKPELTDAYYAVAVDYDTLKNYTEAHKWYMVFINNSSDQTNQYVKYAKERTKQI